MRISLPFPLSLFFLTIESTTKRGNSMKKVALTPSFPNYYNVVQQVNIYLSSFKWSPLQFYRESKLICVTIRSSGFVHGALPFDRPVWSDGDKAFGQQCTPLFETFSPLSAWFTHRRSNQVGFHDSDSNADLWLHFIFIPLLGNFSDFAHFDQMKYRQAI